MDGTCRCLRCEHLWLDQPGQLAKAYRFGCPNCGYLYWTWSKL
jgi:hypothetical protein